MSSIEEALAEYLVYESVSSLNYMINPSNGLYSLILKLFNRNGIYRDRFPYEEFPSLLFITLKTYRDQLLSLIDKDNMFGVISKLSNLMLKSLNKKMYRENVSSSKEIFGENILDDIKTNVMETKKVINVHEILKKYDCKDKLVLGMYFGVSRSYSLNVDQICSIVKVKRSSTFAKIKKFKEDVKWKNLSI